MTPQERAEALVKKWYFELHKDAHAADRVEREINRETIAEIAQAIEEAVETDRYRRAAFADYGDLKSADLAVLEYARELGYPSLSPNQLETWEGLIDLLKEKVAARKEGGKQIGTLRRAAGSWELHIDSPDDDTLYFVDGKLYWHKDSEWREVANRIVEVKPDAIME